MPTFSLWIASLWSILDLEALVARARARFARLDADTRHAWRFVAGALLVIAIGIQVRAVWRVQTRFPYPFDLYETTIAPIRDRAEPGERVFNAGYDDFPILFAGDDRLRYLWGLDPTFLYDVDPDLSNTERTWLRLRRRAHKVGVRPLELHCTRPTWATFALEAGRSVRWVADVRGHADPALTLRVYAHAMRAEEGDLSFADFGGRKQPADGPGRPDTAPADSAIPDEAASFERSGDKNTGISEDLLADWMVAQARIELATPAFSVRCSTN